MQEAAKKQANRAAQEAADQKAASTTALEKPHSKGELEHAIDTGQGQRIAKLDNSGHEGSADESTVQEASTANQKVLAKQDWPEDAQKQKDELRKVAQEKAAQLQVSALLRSSATCRHSHHYPSALSHPPMQPRP